LIQITTVIDQHVTNVRNESLAEAMAILRAATDRRRPVRGAVEALDAVEHGATHVTWRRHHGGADFVEVAANSERAG
jgi:hypothetical protein